MNAVAAVAPRLGQLIRLLASDQDGEALAAARALKRTLEKAGRSFHDLAEAIEHPPVACQAPSRRPTIAPTWGLLSHFERLAFLRRVTEAEWLSSWEAEFASSVQAQFARRGGDRLSPKQVATIDRLLRQAWERGEVRL